MLTVASKAENGIHTRTAPEFPKPGVIDSADRPEEMASNVESVSTVVSCKTPPVAEMLNAAEPPSQLVAWTCVTSCVLLVLTLSALYDRLIAEAPPYLLELPPVQLVPWVLKMECALFALLPSCAK